MKKNNRTVYIIILILGILNLSIAAFDIISGNPVDKYIFTLFIGITLTGLGYLRLRAKPGTDEEAEL